MQTIMSKLSAINEKREAMRQGATRGFFNGQRAFIMFSGGRNNEDTS